MYLRPFAASLLLACALSGGGLSGRGQGMDGMQMHKAPAQPSTALTVSVNGKATTFSGADLKAMPQKTVTVHNEHTKAEETYSGVLLSDVLAKCGFMADQAHHRELLRSYIVAEGTDKYRVLYSAVEVEGSAHTGDVLVATALNGKELGADGQFKLIDTADKKPQRWVRNLTGITVRTAE